jgi:hypothetical protein
LKAECTTLRKEPLENGSVSLYVQGMKAGQHPKRKDKCESQHGIMAPFARAVIDVKWGPPLRRKSSNTPAGFSG